MLALFSRTRIGTVERANPLLRQRCRLRPSGASRWCRSRSRLATAVMAAALPGRLAGPRVQLSRVAFHVDAPDPHDRRLGPDLFVVSLRYYRPGGRAIARAPRLKAALSTAEGLLLQARGEGELIELSDDEAVAAAVMLPMVATDGL